MKKIFVEEVVNAMGGCLDDGQIKRLRMVLEAKLYAYDLTKKETELATSSDINSQIIRIYMLNKKIEKYSDKTIMQIVRAVQHFFNFIMRDYTTIQLEDATYYMAHLMYHTGWCACTIDNERRFLKAFFQWLVDNDFLQKNPFAHLRPIKQDEREVVILTDDEIENMKTACCSLFDKTLLHFILSTGVRIGELIKIKKSDMDLVKGEVRIYASKTRKYRTVFLSFTALEYVNKYMKERSDKNPYLFYLKSKDKPCLPNTIERHLQKIALRAGINKHITVHIFRKTLGSRLSKNGMPLEEISEILGHKSTQTTLKYYISLDKERIKEHFSECMAE